MWRNNSICIQPSPSSDKKVQHEVGQNETKPRQNNFSSHKEICLYLLLFHVFSRQCTADDDVELTILF